MNARVLYGLGDKACLAGVGALLVFSTSCAEQAPSFQENRSVRTVDLVLADDEPVNGQGDSLDANRNPFGSVLASGATDGATDEADGATEAGDGATDGATDSAGDGGNYADAGVDGMPGIPGSGGDAGATDGATDGATGGDGASDGASDGSVDGDVALPDGDTPNEADVKACAKKHGVPASRVVLAGNQSSKKITSSSIVAIKMTGNKSVLELNLKGTGRIAGMCVFLAGNQPHAVINAELSIGGLYYVGRGNQSNTVFNFAASSTLSGLYGDLAGNQASLTFTGDGTFPCQTVKLRGNGTAFHC